MTQPPTTECNEAAPTETKPDKPGISLDEAVSIVCNLPTDPPLATCQKYGSDSPTIIGMKVAEMIAQEGYRTLELAAKDLLAPLRA